MTEAVLHLTTRSRILDLSGHFCLEFHPTLEEQILKLASIGIKK